MKILLQILLIITIISGLDSCCSLCTKSSSISRDTLRFTIYDTVSVSASPKVIYKTDTLNIPNYIFKTDTLFDTTYNESTNEKTINKTIKNKPFQLIFDTIISHNYNDRITSDTLHFDYNYRINKINILIKQQKDKFLKINEHKIDVIEKSKSWFEQLKDNLVTIIISIMIGLIGGFAITRKI